MNEGNEVVIVNDEDSVMMSVKGISVEGDRIKIRGALMGSWDTDMYVDLKSIQNAVGLIPMAEMMQFVMDKVLNMTITKIEK